MSKTQKHLALMMLISISILTLTGCQQNTDSVDNNQDQNIEQPVAQNVQKLVINDGCIGCGHCVKNAPQNFTMNGRTAQVSSQENIDSTDVTRAIKNCPVSVIEIIEV